MVEHRSPKPGVEGSIPSTPASAVDSELYAFLIRLSFSDSNLIKVWKAENGEDVTGSVYPRGSSGG